jgi:hypothetical protein
VRVLEKTPKNALRVPFIDRVFPQAHFVYLYRDVRETLASMIEAWQSGRFVTYPELPDWRGPPWSLLLVPGWRELAGKPVAEIVAAQWQATTDCCSTIWPPCRRAATSRARCAARRSAAKSAPVRDGACPGIRPRGAASIAAHAVGAGAGQMAKHEREIEAVLLRADMTARAERFAAR